MRLWDALTGNCLHLFQCDSDGNRLEIDNVGYGLEMNINFSPDGKLLACRGSEVKVLRVATGQVAAVCNVAGKKVCWNTRGNKLAIVTNDVDPQKDVGPERNILVFDV